VAGASLDALFETAADAVVRCAAAEAYRDLVEGEANGRTVVPR